tara:strand:+ start:16550 stop:17569 length:1020 start_codon:yes stop_codon:yes gene_type:complete
MEQFEKILPKNVEIFLFTFKKYNKYNKQKLKRTKIIEVKSNSKKDFILQLRDFCKKNKINLLFNLGTPHESFGSLIATAFTQTDYFINIYSNPIDAPFAYKKFYQKIIPLIKTISLVIPFAFSKKIMCVKDVGKRIRQTFPFLKHKVKPISLIMDEKLFRKKNKDAARKKLKLPEKKDILIFVGRVEYLKGSDFLYSIIKKNPDKLFIIISKVLDQKFLSSPPPNTLLLDSASPQDLSDYYNASDLCLLPSRTEGYGLVSRESMLCKTPALVSNIPSLRAIDNVIKAELNPEDFQKKINWFFSLSQKEKQELGRISRQGIVKETSFKNLKHVWRDVLLN